MTTKHSRRTGTARRFEPSAYAGIALRSVVAATVWWWLRFEAGVSPAVVSSGSPHLDLLVFILVPTVLAGLFIIGMPDGRPLAQRRVLAVLTLAALVVWLVELAALRNELLPRLGLPASAWLAGLVHVDALIAFTLGIVVLRTACSRSRTPRRRTAREWLPIAASIAGALLIACATIAVVARVDTQLLAAYPRLRIDLERLGVVGASFPQGLLYYLAYLGQFALLEAFFRGTLLRRLRESVGVAAIPCAAFAYMVLHLHKPPVEAAASFFGGLLLGAIAWRSGGIAIGFALHAGIALFMEVLAFGLRTR